MFGLPITFDQVSQSILLLGGVVFIAGYGYKQFTAGGKKADSDLIDLLTKQIEAQKAVIDSQREQRIQDQEGFQRQLTAQQEQINKLTLEIGKLQGEKTANDQKIKEYLQLIANRNPELEETLLTLDAAVQQVVPFMEEVRTWHQGIQQALGIDENGNLIPPKRKRTVTNKTTEVIN